LKDLVTTESTLQYFRVNHPVIIQTDASTVGLGAMLMQQGKPVCYASRSLTTSEKNYAPIELELLAIVYAMQKFDQYVFGNLDVTVHTDHQPLETIMKKSLLKAPKRLQSMLLALQRYPMKVVYKPGVEQVTADMLSRSPTDKAVSGLVDEQIFVVNQIQSFLSDMDHANPRQDLPVSEETYQMIQQETKADLELQILMELILNGWPRKLADVAEQAKPYFTYKDELAVMDGIIYRGHRLVVPTGSRTEILNKLHSSHQGTAATIRRARAAVFWPNMSSDIQQHTERCVTCAMDAPMQQKETLNSHDIPGKLWSKVGLDILTYKAKDYLILVDYLSDFFECERLSDLQPNAVIKACKKTFARYGIPNCIQSDNGPQFVSREFEKFSREWGFMHTTSSPGHQQSNGKAEAAVKIIKKS
jgi:hypothetical protein